MNKKENNIKKEKTIILITMITMLIVFISATYAFFTANNPEGSTAQIISDTGRMLITYDDGTDSITPVKDIQPSNAILVNKTFTLTGSNTTVGMSSSDGLTMPYQVGLGYTSTFSDGMIHYYIKEVERPQDSAVTVKYTGETDKSIPGNETLTGYSHGTLNRGEERYAEMVTGEFPASLNNQTIKFNLIIQFPDNNKNQDSEKGKTINGRIIINNEFVSITQTISDLYSNNEKDENGITVDGLQKDGTGAYNIQTVSASNEKYSAQLLGNIPNNIIADTETDAYDNLRYVGANPNNYLLFNDEPWRIIGIFKVYNAETNKYENLVKIIRDESIGNYSWDTSAGTGNTGDGTRAGIGVNDWSQADLMTELNTDYIDTTKTSGITYWYNGLNNAKNGEYSYSKNIKKEYIDKIANVRWNLGSTYYNPYGGISALESYNQERGTNVYSGHAVTWNGKIALMYSSDYAYASTDQNCREHNGTLGTSYCINNNWLSNNTNQWTLTPSSTYYYYVSYVAEEAGIRQVSAFSSVIGVRPTIFLKSDVSIIAGSGTKEEPFRIDYKAFRDDSWSTIAENIKSGKASIYEVGSEKEVEIDGTNYTVRVVNNSNPSECNNENFSQTACGFVVDFVDIVEERAMNTTSTNVGGWKSSELRTYANGDFINKLPEELQKIIIDTKVISGHGSTEGEENFETTDKIYLLNYKEINFNYYSLDSAKELTRILDFYTINTNVTKNKQYNNNVQSYWLRPAKSNSNNKFACAYKLFSYEWDLESTEVIGFAPSFRIG